MQSVCATEDYIICIENFNDLTTEPDVVSAYYKNDTDADGNPVTQYSLAHQVRDADFAHANGMAYNPVTHEILVSGYSSPDASNYGCIFRLDPDTLEQKERIQLSTSYNILGIDYLPSTGGYLIQTCLLYTSASEEVLIRCLIFAPENRLRVIIIHRNNDRCVFFPCTVVHRVQIRYEFMTQTKEIIHCAAHFRTEVPGLFSTEGTVRACLLYTSRCV